MQRCAGVGSSKLLLVHVYGVGIHYFPIWTWTPMFIYRANFGSPEKSWSYGPNILPHFLNVFQQAHDCIKGARNPQPWAAAGAIDQENAESHEEDKRYVALSSVHPGLDGSQLATKRVVRNETCLLEEVSITNFCYLCHSFAMVEDRGLWLQYYKLEAHSYVDCLPRRSESKWWPLFWFPQFKHDAKESDHEREKC